MSAHRFVSSHLNSQIEYCQQKKQAKAREREKEGGRERKGEGEEKEREREREGEGGRERENLGMESGGECGQPKRLVDGNPQRWREPKWTH
jgi:hypothetical protein